MSDNSSPPGVFRALAIGEKGGKRRLEILWGVLAAFATIAITAKVHPVSAALITAGLVSAVTAVAGVLTGLMALHIGTGQRDHHTREDDTELLGFALVAALAVLGMAATAEQPDVLACGFAGAWAVGFGFAAWHGANLDEPVWLRSRQWIGQLLGRLSLVPGAAALLGLLSNGLSALPDVGDRLFSPIAAAPLIAGFTVALRLAPARVGVRAGLLGLGACVSAAAAYGAAGQNASTAALGVLFWGIGLVICWSVSPMRLSGSRTAAQLQSADTRAVRLFVFCAGVFGWAAISIVRKGLPWNQSVVMHLGDAVILVAAMKLDEWIAAACARDAQNP